MNKYRGMGKTVLLDERLARQLALLSTMPDDMQALIGEVEMTNESKQEISALRDLISRDQTNDANAVKRINGVIAQLNSRQKALESAHERNDIDKGDIAFNDLVEELESVRDAISGTNEASEDAPALPEREHHNAEQVAKDVFGSASDR